MSERPSTLCPAIRSGDMYFGDPKAVPTKRAAARRQQRNAEVGDLDPAVVEHHDVCGLDVAVHDSVLVREREAVGNLRDDVRDPFGRENDARVEDFAQRPALQELHGDIGGAIASAHVVDRDDVGMIEAPGGLGFAEEPLFECRGLLRRQVEADGLDGHGAIDQRVARLVHDAHRAAAEFPGDFVAAKQIGWHGCVSDCV